MSNDGIERFSIELPIDGYETRVHINVASLKRRLDRLEEKEVKEINRNGLNQFNLSKFATIGVEPEPSKWMELANKEEE